MRYRLACTGQYGNNPQQSFHMVMSVIIFTSFTAYLPYKINIMILKNKNAIVYGAAGSIGGAVAKALTSEGQRCTNKEATLKTHADNTNPGHFYFDLFVSCKFKIKVLFCGVSLKTMSSLGFEKVPFSALIE